MSLVHFSKSKFRLPHISILHSFGLPDLVTFDYLISIFHLSVFLSSEAGLHVKYHAMRAGKNGEIVSIRICQQLL